MKRIIFGAVLALFLIGGGLWLAGFWGGPAIFAEEQPQPYSRESFDHWLSTDPVHQLEFEAMLHFLASHDVGSVVPVWQLTRTDSNLAKKCKRPEFLIPPREKWDAVVPVLKLIQRDIEPVLGEVEVKSSYRTEEFNSCLGGAGESRHLDFAALDLTAPEASNNRELFKTLCGIQRKLGPASRMGLGAYFDPAEPDKGAGRFHIDLSGYRSWGFSKLADSSGCKAFS